MLIIPILVLADGYSTSQPSHPTLWADTITSRTDASPVSVADSQGLFVTGDVTTLGKVGIGTAGPVAKLDVSVGRGGAANAIRVLDSVGGNAARAWIAVDASGHGVIQASDVSGTQTVNIRSAGGDTYFTGGNVGIGTAGPLGKLVVSSSNGPGDSTGDLVLLNPTAYANGNVRTSAISFKTNNPDSLSIYESASIRAEMTPSAGVTVPQSNLQFFTASNAVGRTEKVRISESGNVGIGTTGPESPLHTKGTPGSDGPNLKYVARLDDTAAMAAGVGGGIAFSGIYTGSAQGVFAGIQGFKENAIDNNFAGAFRIYTRTNSGNLIEQVRVDSNGNVGIGTAGPGYPLVVFRSGDGSLLSLDSGNGRFTYFGQDTAGGYIEQRGDTNARRNLRLQSFDGTSYYQQLFIDAANQRVYIPSGNVGIGTANPTVSQSGVGLHISGSSGGLRLQNSANGGWAYTEYYDETGTGKFIEGYRDSGPYYAIMAGTNLGATTGIVLDTSGNVGIGVTSPGKKLQVGSNLHTTGDGALIDGVLGLSWGTGVPAPPAGQAYLWLDSSDGALKVKFSNGVVRTLASP